MKKRILKMIKNEGGQALLLVIALLGVGGIMLAPMLAFMGTGLETGRVYESKERVIYAADAGVEEAIWNIQNGGAELVVMAPDGWPVTTLDGLPPYIYENVADPENPYQDDGSGTYYDIADVNGNSVRITIEHHSETGGTAYKVTSKAPNDGSGTVIETWVTEIYSDFSGITDTVITSPSDPGYDIDTGVEYPDGEYDPDTNPNGARDNYDGPWPTPAEMMAYYSMFVNKTNPYYYDDYLEELDLDDSDTFDYDFITDNGNEIRIGAAYIEGDFDIINSSNTEKTLILDGNLYITGRANFGGAKDWRLNLNGHSIFVESDATGGGASGTALRIESKVTLTGSGCLIAVGDIDFQPHMDASPTDYILVLSVIGETRMLPNGSFYGTLAGNVFVDVKSGSDPHIEWTDPDTDGDGIPDVDFPGGSSATVLYGVLSWKIS
ncbi:TadE/TadG family type IV pilus assembly protein [Chloroflexota bacterium]